MLCCLARKRADWPSPRPAEMRTSFWRVTAPGSPTRIGRSTPRGPELLRPRPRRGGGEAQLRDDGGGVRRPPFGRTFDQPPADGSVAFGIAGDSPVLGVGG